MQYRTDAYALNPQSHRVPCRKQRLFYIKCGLLVYAIWISAYMLVGSFIPRLHASDLRCWIDTAIPLEPGFVWPYTFCYVFPILVGASVSDWHRLNRGLLTILFASFSAFIIFMAFPISFPRPALGASISDRLLAVEYAIDVGAANMPSLHVVFAWLVCLIGLKQGFGKTVEYCLFGMAVLITISSLFVKQHTLVDAVVGIIWTFAVWGAAGFFYQRWTGGHSDPMAAFRQMVRRSIPFIVTCIAIILFLGWCTR